MVPQAPTQTPPPPSGLASTDLSATSRDKPAELCSQSKPFLCRRPVRVAIYAFFALLLLFMLAWRYLPGLLDPTFEKHIQSKRVMVGMTREQVLKAWGSPYTINVSYTKDGIRREEWIFEDWKDASTVKHRYLYFEEGILAGGWYYQ
ncbi:MAG: hypothetical protein HY581_06885 [Nitrospirae bacterium]|nr:hypothetical protein [Nitrospirota bacterium]